MEGMRLDRSAVWSGFILLSSVLVRPEWRQMKEMLFTPLCHHLSSERNNYCLMWEETKKTTNTCHVCTAKFLFSPDTGTLCSARRLIFLNTTDGKWQPISLNRSNISHVSPPCITTFTTVIWIIQDFKCFSGRWLDNYHHWIPNTFPIINKCGSLL